jgi:checkpoint serine/threonine-protein kinase
MVIMYLYLQSLAQIKNIVVVPSKNQVMVHPQTGKKEYIFVDLAAVYPTPEEPGTEVSFEEIIARNRGWLDCAWEDETMDENRVFQTAVPLNEIEEISNLAVHKDVTMYDENGAVIEQHSAPKAGKKKKLMEVNETQISTCR